MTPLDVLIRYAWSFVGTLYRWGGDDPTGWDCSGLCIEILSSVGEAPPQDTTAQGLYDYFLPRSRHTGVCPGALVFYGRRIDKITHVAFCITDLCVIEAGGGDRTTTTETKAAEQNAFVRVRPAYARKDVAAILRPAYRFETRK